MVLPVASISQVATYVYLDRRLPARCCGQSHASAPSVIGSGLIARQERVDMHVVSTVFVPVSAAHIRVVFETRLISSCLQHGLSSSLILW